jgi:hypothetical protein
VQTRTMTDPAEPDYRETVFFGGAHELGSREGQLAVVTRDGGKTHTLDLLTMGAQDLAQVDALIEALTAARSYLA